MYEKIHQREKPIQYRTDRCKDLNAENTVCPINKKMMDMDNVKLNSSIHVFMYRIIVLL